LRKFKKDNTMRIRHEVLPCIGIVSVICAIQNHCHPPEPHLPISCKQQDSPHGRARANGHLGIPISYDLGIGNRRCLFHSSGTYIISS
jgi:hypothetical protein